MKKQFLNIKDFVHINLSRGDKSEVLNEDLINAEKRVELIKQTCANSEKKITSCLQTAGSGVESLPKEKRLKKMPQMQLYQCFTELAEQLGTDSILGLTLSECSKLQNHLGNELLNYEMETEKQCLNALTKVTEVEIPVVTKARKQLTKSTTDMDSFRVKYQTALKLAQQSTGSAGSAISSAQKAESLKKELEDSTIKVDQTRDVFASEMFGLLANESDYAHIFLQYFRLQSNYHKRMQELMEVYLPLIEKVIENNSQKRVFGTALDEHLRVTKREISLVLETCVGWLLHSLSEEGLFRIPGSTSKVRKLKNAFDAGIIDCEEYARDTHTVAGALKSYLRELPEPLFTYSLYPEWVSAAKVNDIDARLQALWKVLNQLPKANFNNMRYLVKFLAKLSNNSDSNKMSSQNLAIAISPSLIWPQQESQPFDVNMTAANFHSLILDALINYSEWFFPGELNFVTYALNGDRVLNGDNTYSGDSNKAQQSHRTAKKPAPAPPVSHGVKPLKRSGSLNGTKSSSDSKNSFDLSETESLGKRESIGTSLESNIEMTFDETNDSTTHSSVIYSTASLDRPTAKGTDSPSDRQNSNDRKVSANIQLRNKLIEKPNVPPPSVPIRNSLERPQSITERPTIPPPERPQRSCDNKVKQRSTEGLNDSHCAEDRERDKSRDNDSNSKSMYPSLHELIDSDSNDCESNDNSSVDSLKTKTFAEKDCIAFADDSDIEDNNNVSNNKYNKIDSNFMQRIRQSIPIQTPLKPPRAQSPANLIDKCDQNVQSVCDESHSNDYKPIPNTTTNTNEAVGTNAVVAQPRPPRPLPPSKPKIAASSEDTHL